MSSAEHLKEKGNQAFQEGDFNTAIDFFTEAISIASNNDDGKLHVYFSNRSAAHLSAGNPKEALEDAKKSIKAKPDWPKSYSRKGNALIRLNRMTEAIEAYQNGLRLDPNNENLKTGLAEATRRDKINRGIDDDGSGARSTSAPDTATPSTSYAQASARRPAHPDALKRFVMGDRAAQIRSLQFGLRTFMLLNFLGYLIPFTGAYFSQGCFYRFVKAAVLNYIIYLFWTHGKPRFSRDYAATIVQDQTSHYLFLCFVLLSSNPYLLAIVPVAMSEAIHFSWYVSQVLIMANPSVHCAIGKQLDKLMPSFTQHPRYVTLSVSDKWRAVQGKVPEYSAIVEVYQGIIMILEILTPRRNLFLLLLYWQFLRIRYLTSTFTKSAFAAVDAKIRRLADHHYCPSIVRLGYAKVTSFLASMVEIPDASQQQSRSKCSIM